MNSIDMIKVKTASATGLMRLYGALYQTLQIECQFVLAADRDEAIIDRNFENWDNCDYQLLYFPTVHNFLAPTKTEYRYPWISHPGLVEMHCSLKVSALDPCILPLQKLKQYPYRIFNTYNNLDAKLTLNPDMDSLVLDMKFIFGGYEAAIFRDGFDFLTPEQTQNAIKEYAKRSIGTETILLSELQNTSLEEGNSGKTIHPAVSK
jgi:hypothetical protein